MLCFLQLVDEDVSRDDVADREHSLAHINAFRHCGTQVRFKPCTNQDVSTTL